MSEAALTDSTTAHTSPACKALPTLGSSMNTRSPSACCAWSVMPTARFPSASVRTHSWLSVYLRSAGTFIESLLGLDKDFSIAHERRLDNASGKQLVAYRDLNHVAE